MIEMIETENKKPSCH